jgi:hypothetical protein
MKNPRKGRTVAMASGGDGLRAIDHQQQQADTLNTTAAGPNVKRRQMLTAFATTGIALAQVPMIAPVAAQVSAEADPAKQEYFLNVGEFIQSLVEIPVAPVKFNPPPNNPHSINTTTSTKYLAGIANIYDPSDSSVPPKRVGRCSASFLCYRNGHEIYTDISNFISVDNGLIVSWFTPTTLKDLLADTAVRAMVTECLVEASTKIGVNPFYGDTFNLKVSSDKNEDQVHFKFVKL